MYIQFGISAMLSNTQQYSSILSTMLSVMFISALDTQKIWKGPNLKKVVPKAAADYIQQLEIEEK